MHLWWLTNTNDVVGRGHSLQTCLWGDSAIQQVSPQLERFKPVKLCKLLHSDQQQQLRFLCLRRSLLATIQDCGSSKAETDGCTDELQDKLSTDDYTCVIISHLPEILMYVHFLFVDIRERSRHWWRILQWGTNASSFSLHAPVSGSWSILLQEVSWQVSSFSSHHGSQCNNAV